MKLMIDIDEDVRIAISRMGLLRIPDEMQKEVDRAIQSGTPIPDNATNDDVLKALFDERGYMGIHDRMMHTKWLFAPYQKGGTNRKNCEYRHENGNCLKVGGFCTSVDDEHCVKGCK